MHCVHRVTALVLSLASFGASAEGVRVERNMSLELATKIAAATVAAAQARMRTTLQHVRGAATASPGCGANRAVHEGRAPE